MPKRPLHKHPAFAGTILLGLVVLFLAVGTVFYHFQEHFSWLDSALFSVATATTVGYGSKTPHTALGKIVTMIYIFVAVIIVTAFINHFSKRTRKSGLLHRFFSGPDSGSSKKHTED